MKNPRLLGFGAPLVDFLCRVDDDFLRRYVPGEKGGMVHADSAEQDRLLERLNGQYAFAPGGAAGNTVFALARLGGDASMLGMIGKDRYGKFYRERLQNLGGDPRYLFETDEAETGRCLSLITPDSERTMRSFLGASQRLTPENVAAVDFSAFDIVYIEGYQIFNRDAMLEVLRRARAAGCRIGYDLASFEVVRTFASDLPELLRDYVDTVFANELEAAEFVGERAPGEMARELARYCRQAVVKIGSRGSILARGNETWSADALHVQAVDSTAAGDLWTAGFWYGEMNGFEPVRSLELGSRLGAEAVQVVGSELPDERWEAIRAEL